MLLVSFHGGDQGVNNLYGYSTKDGELQTKEALSVKHHDDVKLAEISRTGSLRQQSLCGERIQAS